MNKIPDPLGILHYKVGAPILRDPMFLYESVGKGSQVDRIREYVLGSAPWRKLGVVWGRICEVGLGRGK
jgi:hypothetical protein